MGNNRQTNTFSGGMNMDLDYSILKDNQYTYAENIRVVANDSHSFGILQNIEGFIKTNPSTNIQGSIIHVNTIRDIAVVFTKNGDLDFIYTFDFSESDLEPKVSTVVNGKDLGIKPSKDSVWAISTVCRWESKDNIKVYWADGQSQLKVINIAKLNQDINEDTVNILPKGILPQLEFKSFGAGSLKAGNIQYCYQLFNPRSSETSISILTPLIHLTKSENKTNSNEVIGDAANENTGKSVILTTELINNKFTRAKIISVHYKDNTSVPVISVVDDISISGSTLTYEDKGSSFVSELSVDEFNSLSSYVFIPEVIESKDNMLFAANITEETWDISNYDTRAYRCDVSGNVQLLSNTSTVLSFPVSEINTKNVPSDHDCICPYNDQSNSNYRYRLLSDGTAIYGGTGKNIDYEFIVTDLIEDDATMTSRTAYDESYLLNSKSVNNISRLPVYRVASTGERIAIDNINIEKNTGLLNYANAEIDSKVKGYQRDEIYRFGIVFYNKSNIASSMHWIADIRTPKATDYGFDIFHSNFSVKISNVSTEQLHLVTHPLGIRFTVRNLPEDVTGFEIVRCERTLSDRRVLMQGVVSNVVTYDKSSVLVGMPYISYANRHGYVSYDGSHTYKFNMSEFASPTHFSFISPELCVNRENSEEILDKVSGIKSIYDLTSNIFPTITGGASATEKVLANTPLIKDNSGKFVGTATDPISRNTGFLSAADEYPYIIYGANQYYSATLAKYYGKTSRVNEEQAFIQNIKIAKDTDPFDVVNSTWKPKGITVGNKTYCNWTWSNIKTDATEGDANNVQRTGPHGICAIFQSSDMLKNIPLITCDSSNRIKVNSTVLCNLIQTVSPYGGNSVSSRQNSVYISTGSYKLNSNNSENNVICYGGDTYIGILDYANTMFFFNPEKYDDWNSNRTYNGAYIPMESSINLSLRGDSVQISKTFQSDGYTNHYVQNNIISIGDIYTQSEPLYRYNSAYSAQARVKKFVSKSLYDKDNVTNDSRVMNSLVKTNDEVIDSWTKFKVANYIDVDNRFGPINHMKLFKNNLLFWQSDAVGMLAVNERSLITDNNNSALTLGTGGILTRFEYITTKNGIKENQLRAVTQSDSTVYWYDSYRNEICGFDSNLQTVSKLKGVQSFLNDKKDSFTNDPSTVYDKKYNEVLFTLDDKTLVFNEQLGAFTSFYTIKPDRYVEFTDKLFTFKNLSLFKYNYGNKFNLYTDKKSYIRFVVNKDYAQTKTFDNVEYSGNFSKGSNFDAIDFDTKRQKSYTTSKSQIDYREDTYKFSIPRNQIEMNEAEQIVNKSFKDRMKGKYLVCHYKYDCKDNNTFEVPYISTAYRYSMI